MSYREYLTNRSLEIFEKKYLDLYNHVSSDYDVMYNQTVEKVYQIFQINKNNPVDS
jgi:hypothetical protein